MTNNIERFEQDVNALVARGELLKAAMWWAVATDKQREEFKKKVGEERVKRLPDFDEEYQSWYSESVALLKQILPDRLDDFIRHYEKPRVRKEITFSSYTIEDYLQGTRVRQGVYDEIVVDRSAARNRFDQQCAIVKAASTRFKSSLYDIRAMVHADLLDSEIGAAKELNKHKFIRAAGAIAGVVLERHLKEVCGNRNLVVGKKNPTISDFNELLKASDVIGVPDWRFIQHLADIRNICDHSKEPEPTHEQVTDLINGVDKIIKTIF